MHLTSLFVASGLARLGLTAYSIKDDYSTDRFLDMFNFDTFDDPTHGYVNYIDQATADSQDLYNVSNGQVTWGVDHVNIASGRGRNSIRLTSKASYTHGLVILDLAHMPGGACGVWPAFWMTGPNWPYNGEIDIIEGVGNQAQNQMTMHTGPGCNLAGSSCEGGLGCHIKPQGSNNYGTGLNNAGGGIYAMEWTSGSINIWFFPRNAIPSDISTANPSPSTWGAATASFVGGDSCNIDQNFKDNNIVFDTTFCGDWAGGVWSQDGTCAAQAGTCQEYVQNHPEAYADAYWTINSLKVYQDDGNVQQVVEKNVVPEVSSVIPSMVAPTPVATSIEQPASTKSAPVYTATTTVGAGGQNYNFYAPSKAASKVYTATTTVGARKHNYNFYAPTKAAAPAVGRSVATDSPAVQQIDDVETANDTTVIASRDVEGGNGLVKSTLDVDKEESKPEELRKQKMSRHLHRHVHHLGRS
ncbi:MAG: hypothetical protein Q9169_001796 [Polycauliona sp. 2 TL-2023]